MSARRGQGLPQDAVDRIVELVEQGVSKIEVAEKFGNTRHAPWAFGPWCFLLREPRPLARVIPWKGELGFFSVPIIAEQS